MIVSLLNKNALTTTKKLMLSEVSGIPGNIRTFSDFCLVLTTPRGYSKNGCDSVIAWNHRIGENKVEPMIYSLCIIIARSVFPNP
jgi:hypothetical protein